MRESVSGARGESVVVLADPEATEQAGAALAAAILATGGGQITVTLDGDLGAGKTTFARGFMRGFGHAGRVPSPTYTLVEPYVGAGRRIFHMDLYRLQDGAELHYLGIDEMAGDDVVLLIEWPSRAADSLPDKDVTAQLKVIPEGRSLQLHALSETGAALTRACLDALQNPKP